MAFLYVEEFTELPLEALGRTVLTPSLPVAKHRVAISGTVARTTVDFHSGTEFIRLVSDIACQFEIGDVSTVVATNSPYLPASLDHYRGVHNKVKRVAVQTPLA